MKLPFTLKNKRKKLNLKFLFKTTVGTFLDSQKIFFFGFCRKLPQKLNIFYFLLLFFARALKFWIWTSKITPELWLVDLF